MTPKHETSDSEESHNNEEDGENSDEDSIPEVEDGKNSDEDLILDEEDGENSEEDSMNDDYSLGFSSDDEEVKSKIAPNVHIDVNRMPKPFPPSSTRPKKHKLQHSDLLQLDPKSNPPISRITTFK